MPARQMNDTIIATRPRPWQIQAYAEAAARSGISRNLWARKWCSYAAGFDPGHPSRVLAVRPPGAAAPRTNETTVSLSVRASQAEAIAWDRAARAALMPRAAWILAVLDAAVGVSDLADQLGKVEAAQ